MATGSFYTNWSGPSYAQYRLKIDWNSSGRNVTVTATFYGSGGSSQMGNIGHTCSLSIGGVTGSIYKQVSISNNGSQVMGSTTLTVNNTIGTSGTLSASCPVKASWSSGTMTGSGTATGFTSLGVPTTPSFMTAKFYPHNMSVGVGCELKWGASTPPAGATITQYRLIFQKSTEPYWHWDWVQVDGNTTQFNFDINLNQGEGIVFGVTAVASNGQSSSYAHPSWITFPSKYDPPTNVVLTLTPETSASSVAVRLQVSGATTKGSNAAIRGYTITRRTYDPSTKTWSGYIGYTTITTTATSFDRTWQGQGLASGLHHYFYVKTLSNFSYNSLYDSNNKISNGSQNPQFCSAPTAANLTVTPTNTTTGTSYNITGSGASGKEWNTITGYEFQYFRSDLNEWRTWFTHSTTATSFSILNRAGTMYQGTTLKYRVRTQGSAGVNRYSAWKESNVATNPSACGAPTDFTLQGEPFEVSQTYIDGIWSGASAGILNNIVGYEFSYRRYYKDSDTFSSWSDGWAHRDASSTSGSTTFTANSVEPGDGFQIRIRTKGSAGVYRYSDWTEGNVVYQPTVAVPFVTFEFTQVLQQDSINASLIGTGAEALINSGDNAILGYEIQRASESSENVWGAWIELGIIEETASDLSAEFNNIPVPFGMRSKFRVRTKSSAGDIFISEWKESNILLNPDKCGIPENIQLSENSEVTWVIGSDKPENSIISQGLEVYAKTSEQTDWVKLTELELSSEATSYDIPSEYLSEHDELYVTIQSRGTAGPFRYSDWEDSNILVAAFSIYMYTNSAYNKFPLFVCNNDEYKRVNMFECVDNEWVKR